MDFWAKIRKSMYHSSSLWILLWLLVLVNILAFLALADMFSYPLFFVWLGLAFIGIVFIKALAYSEEVQYVSREIEGKVQSLMQEIKPLCEDVFEREVNAFIKPLLDEIYEDFEENLRWFWQAGEDFSREVAKHINEMRPVLKIVRSGNEERYKLINKLGDNIELLANINGELDVLPVRNIDDLDRFLTNKSRSLKEALNNEKEIFYEYIYKLLMEQVKGQTADEDITQYFDVYKLVEQFTGILQKSLESRIKMFREEMAGDLANYSADLVGKMQKLTLRIMNILEEINDNLLRLIESGKNESALVLKKLNELYAASTALKERAGEIMLTLAWHDVLLERRWQKMKEELYLLKDKIKADVDEGLMSGIKQIVEQEVPGISYRVNTPKQAVWFKNMLEAELFYQLFKEKRLAGVVDNGAYPLLLLVAVLEDLVLGSIRIGEEGLRIKRDLKREVKNEAYAGIYEQIKELIRSHREGLEIYLEDVFPRLFYAFCNNPYVKMNPDNISLTPWYLFMGLIAGSTKNENISFLTGCLLIAIRLRNKYIDPLKNEPQYLENEEELDYMRDILYRAVAVVAFEELEGIVRMKFMQF